MHFSRCFTVFPLPVLLITAACAGTGQQAPAPEVPSLIEDSMIFDLQVGEGLPEEYAIEWPRDVNANKAGDIFVVQEGQVMVFDRDGQPKKLIGKPGTDPGEFENLHYMTISETGYHVMGGGQFGFTFQIFSSDHELLRKLFYMYDTPYSIEMDDRNLHSDRPRDIVAYAPDEFVYYLQGNDRDIGFESDRTHMIIYEQSDDCQVVAEYLDQAFIASSGTGTTIPTLGRLNWGILPGKRVVFTHPWYDRSGEGEEAKYSLHILSLEDGSQRTVEHPYEPVLMGSEVLDRYRQSIERARDDRSRERWEGMLEVAQERLEGIDFKVPISRLLTDNEYIFAFTFTEDDSSSSLTDIFDAESGRYLRSAYIRQSFPGHGYLSCIVDGYAYYTNFDYEHGNSTVSRFRVNPDVYVK